MIVKGLVVGAYLIVMRIARIPGRDMLSGVQVLALVVMNKNAFDEL